jgi:hypothetical protein
LPQVSRSNINQALSIQALQAVLPVERLRFRKETDDDFGVDGWLEAISDGVATNLRAHAQLKSVERAEPNADGSLSLAVPTYNFNYMLNGPLPIYFLYAADTKELRYAWAQDECRRIEGAARDWSSQETITLRFSLHLDALAADLLWKRIISEGELNRRIRDLVGAVTDPIRIEVDPGAGTLQSSAEAKSLLEHSGIAITNAGFPDKVVELYSILGGDARRSAPILLACAYAECSRGKYAHAASLLVELRLAAGVLSAADAQVLQLVEVYCEFGLGRITSDELLVREAAVVASGPESLRAEHRLRELRTALLRERHPEKRPAISAEIARLARTVESDNSASDERKLRFRLARLEAEDDALMFTLLADFHRFQAARASALPFLRDTRVEDASRWLAKMKVLTETLAATVQDATTLRHPTLVADALAVDAAVQFRTIVTMRMIRKVAATTAAARQTDDLDVPASVVSGLIERLGRARKIFAEAGIEDREVQATLQLADIYAFIGDKTTAHQLANDAARRAEILGYTNSLERARGQLADKWLWEEFDKSADEIHNMDDDEAFARMGPGQLAQYAERAVLLFQLPKDRVPAALKEAYAARAASIERLAFCRHLRPLRDLQDTQARETMWTRSPDWRGACERFGYMSALSSDDIESVIRAFKAAYCATCAYREPKRKK